MAFLGAWELNGGDATVVSALPAVESPFLPENWIYQVSVDRALRANPRFGAFVCSMDRPIKTEMGLAMDGRKMQR